MGFNPHTHAGCDWVGPVLGTPTTCFNPHTHAGCDWPLLVHLFTSRCFNPHTHAGCDQTMSERQAVLQVSIHTPTQGVTVDHCQHRSFITFQSTHPRRVWLHINSFSDQMLSFNPHTHAGCDWEFFLYFHIFLVSIHTPTQGVTLYLITYYKSANLIHCYANHHYYSTS